MSVHRLATTRPPAPALEPLLEAVAEHLAARVAARLRPLLAPHPPAAAALVGVEEAAKLIAVSPSWLAAEARRGAVRSYKRGHYRRYDPREVVEDFKRLAGGAG